MVVDNISFNIWYFLGNLLWEPFNYTCTFLVRTLTGFIKKAVGLGTFMGFFSVVMTPYYTPLSGGQFYPTFQIPNVTIDGTEKLC